MCGDLSNDRYPALPSPPCASARMARRRGPAGRLVQPNRRWPATRPRSRSATATGAQGNPYVVNSPAINSSGDRHGRARRRPQRSRRRLCGSPASRVTWGDIIPPYDYEPADFHYAGLNWTAEGQAIYNNGCNIPEPTEAPTNPPTRRRRPTRRRTLRPTRRPRPDQPADRGSDQPADRGSDRTADAVASSASRRSASSAVVPSRSPTSHPRTSTTC